MGQLDLNKNLKNYSYPRGVKAIVSFIPRSGPMTQVPSLLRCTAEKVETWGRSRNLYDSIRIWTQVCWLQRQGPSSRGCGVSHLHWWPIPPRMSGVIESQSSQVEAEQVSMSLNLFSHP